MHDMWQRLQHQFAAVLSQDGTQGKKRRVEMSRVRLLWKEIPAQTKHDKSHEAPSEVPVLTSAWSVTKSSKRIQI